MYIIFPQNNSTTFYTLGKGGLYNYKDHMKK